MPVAVLALGHSAHLILGKYVMDGEVEVTRTFKNGSLGRVLGTGQAAQ